MAKFDVRVRTPSGAKTFTLNANNEQTVTRLASRYGSVIGYRKVFSWDFLPGMTPRERNLWFYRMASMTANRVPITMALRKMIESFRGPIRSASQKMLTRMEAGFSMVEAVEQDPRNFPPTTAALMRAGVAAGHTSEALQNVAEFESHILNAQKGTMSKIYQALGHYCIALGLMYYSTQYLAPQVLDNAVFKYSGQYNFEWTRTMGFVAMGIMLIIFAFLMALFLLATAGHVLIPVAADKIALKIPLYKDIVLARINQISLYRLSLLIRQGVSTEESLRISYDDTRPGIMREDFNLALNAIRNGKPWADVMTMLHPTDKAALSMSTDKIDVSRTLANLSSTYAQLYIDRTNFAGPFLLTIAAFFMTAAGGILFLQTMIPIMQLLQNVSK